MKKIFIFLIYFFSNFLFAEESNHNYAKYIIENFDTKVEVVTFLHGVGEGLKMYNVMNEENGLPRSFCFPSNLRHTAGDYLAILRSAYLKLDKKNYPTALLLYTGLVDTYPCYN